MKIKNIKLKTNKTFKYFIFSIFIFVLFFITSSTATSDDNYVGSPHMVAFPGVVDYNESVTVSWSFTGPDWCRFYPWDIQEYIPGSNTEYFYIDGVNGTYVSKKLKKDTAFNLNCDGNLNEMVVVKVRTDGGGTGGGGQSNEQGEMPPTEVLTAKSVKEITDTSVKFTGSANPNGSKTSGYFRYSTLEIPPIFCNDIFGSNMRATNEEDLQSGNVPVTFSTTASDLLADTQYYYCAVASNKNGISYGGIGKFTTLLEKEGELSITTGNPKTKDETSAFLNGKFNSTVTSKTWFEFRPKIKDKENPWRKTNEQTHEEIDGSSKDNPGKLEFLLTGLAPGTNYETRAAITRIGERESYPTDYGTIKTFKTKESNNVGLGDLGGGGISITDPCTTPYDVNCNGTGGGGIGSNTPTSNLPDLTASTVTFSSNAINTPIMFSSVIKNQGKNPTTYSPKENIQNTTTTPGAVSFIKNFFKKNKAIAATNSTNNTVGSFKKGDFYNFFQVSTKNPANMNIQQNTQVSAPVSSLNKILKTKTVIAATNSGNTTTSSGETIFDLPPIQMSALGSKSSLIATQNYTFTSTGTYYVRACADKKSRNDVGLISESYENNNCGTWTTINIGGSTSCPVGWTGVYPNCTLTAGENCPIGWTGVYPNCVAPVGNCPVGWTGVYPYCMGPNTGMCPVGWSGIYPNCVSPYSTGGCPIGWSGISPNCIAPTNYTCPTGWYGTYPNCIASTSGYSPNTNYNNNNTTNPSNLVLGGKATPPSDAIVRYHEGIETVLARQIISNTQLAKEYGYEEGKSLQEFAWYLSHYFAGIFGYVDESGKEIRVSSPDIAAYQIYLSNGILTIYEYYDSTIVNIQKITPGIRSIYGYEYYFRK